MRIGHISFRFAGSDGVSLEAAKLTQILARMGHTSYYFAGELDPPSSSNNLIKAEIADAVLLPEAHFTHPAAVWLTNHTFGTTTRHPEFDEKLNALTQTIQQALYEFIDTFKIDLLIPQNILAIPMNLALSQAVVNVIESTGIPTIAHHHDFYWERERYQTNCVAPILKRCFPPGLPNIRHMVINSMAQRTLSEKNFESTVMPNVLDFETPPPTIDAFNKDLREEIGLNPDDVFFLQPTRVIERKGIEFSIELLRQLNDSRNKLVITHHAEYNSIHYLEDIFVIAARAHVPVYYLPARFKPVREKGTGIHKIYSLWDAYIHADFITYPSLYEGFGNALVETLYFQKPVLVNRYKVFQDDIEPTGIGVVKMDEAITPSVVDKVKDLLNDPIKRQALGKENAQIAQQHFSYQVAESILDRIIQSI